MIILDLLCRQRSPSKRQGTPERSPVGEGPEATRTTDLHGDFMASTVFLRDSISRKYTPF